MEKQDCGVRMWELNDSKSHPCGGKATHLIDNRIPICQIHYDRYYGRDLPTRENTK